MKVDFDNLRIQTINDFNRLVRIIENHSEDGYLRIRDLQKPMENLRNGLIGIACCEDENGDFKCVLSDDVRLAEPNFDEQEEDQ